MTGRGARERALSLRGNFATFAAWAFMAESWAGEAAYLAGLFLLGLSLGCLRYAGGLGRPWPPREG